MKNFKTKEWLIENINNDDLIILDARAELNDSNAGFEQYKKGHIKRAQYVDLDNVMTGEIGQHGGRHPLPTMNKFKNQMEDLGINNDSTIIVYDNGDLAMAGRLWWLLKYAGLEKVYVLEDGYNGWESLKEITKDIIKPKKSKDLILNIDESIFAKMEDINSAIESDNIAIIDSRTFDRYSGETEPLDTIPGHIPTALNYPWVDLIKQNKKDLSGLEKYFKDLFKYDGILVHCGSGVTGTVNILFMEEIGLKPKLYGGGYSDWISYKGNKVIGKDNQGVIIE